LIVKLAKKAACDLFYPKDNTTGCTAEACSFRDYMILRILKYRYSSDTIASHQNLLSNSNFLYFCQIQIKN
jgi:peroxiredoxin Q/BCP